MSISYQFAEVERKRLMGSLSIFFFCQNRCFDFDFLVFLVVYDCFHYFTDLVFVYIRLCFHQVIIYRNYL